MSPLTGTFNGRSMRMADALRDYARRYDVVTVDLPSPECIRIAAWLDAAEKAGRPGIEAELARLEGLRQLRELQAERDGLRQELREARARAEAARKAGRLSKGEAVAAGLTLGILVAALEVFVAGAA